VAAQALDQGVIAEWVRENAAVATAAERAVPDPPPYSTGLVCTGRPSMVAFGAGELEDR